MNQKSKGKAKYVAAGFRSDMEVLFDMFFKTNSVRFTDFCMAWKELQFSLIFRGRLHQNEMHEFMDEVYRLTMYQLRSIDLQRRIATLYLLYGLYTKHPLKPKIRIRLTPEFLERFRCLFAECKQAEHFDAAFILMKLHSLKAFDYVYAVEFYGPAIIKNSKLCPSKSSNSVSMGHQLEQTLTPQIAELKAIHTQYQEMKKAQPQAEEVRTLNLLDDDIFKHFTDGVRRLKQKFEMTDASFSGFVSESDSVDVPEDID